VSNGQSGVRRGVDITGGPVFDPTENVKDNLAAAALRQDDLREITKELVDAKLSNLKEIAEIRAKYQETIGQLREGYQEKINHAESGRLDSIRQVDREEVAKTAVAANQAITTLAKQTTDLATTLQKTVTDTATAAEARFSTAFSEIGKRLSALELSASEGKGRGAVIDPQMEKITALVEVMARNQDRGAGKSEGVNSVIVMLIAVGTLVLGVVGAGFFKSSTPQVVYAVPPIEAPIAPVKP